MIDLLKFRQIFCILRKLSYGELVLFVFQESQRDCYRWKSFWVSVVFRKQEQILL